MYILINPNYEVFPGCPAVAGEGGCAYETIESLSIGLVNAPQTKMKVYKLVELTAKETQELAEAVKKGVDFYVAHS